MSESIFDIQISSLDGQQDLMSTVKGNVCLFVNIASKCGYSPTCSRLWSYARTAKVLWELQQVHEEFFDRGFRVVAFPSNDFGGMESRENEEILRFIRENYPFVTFPISEKISVNGVNEHPIYSFIKGPERRNFSDNMADMSDSAKKGQNLAMQAMMRIPHNYEKFLISREGLRIARFNWQDSPLATEPLVFGAGWTIREAISNVV
jgi:glutathione peroxidase